MNTPGEKILTPEQWAAVAYLDDLINELEPEEDDPE